MTDEKVKTPYEILEGSPMFQLSLASKELFHSNFLAWIGSWEQGDKDKSRGKNHPFRSIMKALGANDKNVDNWPEEWYVAREFNNFDLCVLNRMPDAFNPEEVRKPNNDGVNSKDNTISADPLKILLVLENKLKSIPYKQQLDRYVEEARKINKLKENNPNDFDCILLSMASEFPDRVLIKDKWKIASYKDLLNQIKEEIAIDDYYRSIIKDYAKQLNALNQLRDIWCQDLQDQSFLYFNTENHNNKRDQDVPLYKRVSYKFDYQILKRLRIHDLFQKQRYAMMCALLRNKIGTLNDVKIASKDIREDGCNTLVNFNYMHGEPLLDIWLKIDENFVYTIQVQADSYEHGVQWLKSGKSASQLWEMRNSDYSFIWWMRDFDVNGKQVKNQGFDIIGGDSIFIDDYVYPLQPRSRKKKNAGGKETSYYGKYENANSTFIYQTRKIASSSKVKDVLNYIVSDFKILKEHVKRDEKPL